MESQLYCRPSHHYRYWVKFALPFVDDDIANYASAFSFPSSLVLGEYATVAMSL